VIEDSQGFAVKDKTLASSKQQIFFWFGGAANSGSPLVLLANKFKMFL
jgi:hypothetical protein